MRFTNLSLVLALFATFSVTSTTTTSAFPILNNNDILLSRRHLYQRDSNSQLTDTSIDNNSIPSPQLLRSPSSSSDGARMINKRQRPRRLAGDKRGTTGGGLLGNLVNDIAPPNPTTDESSHTDPSPSSIAEPTDSGSEPEPSPTASADEQEPTPAPGDEDKGDSGHEEEATSIPSPSDDAATTTEEPEATTATAEAPGETTADPVSEPTDPAVAITSTSSSTTTATRKSTQMDPTVTKASKDGEVEPTTLPEHKEETNSNAMALTIGVIIAAVVVASFIGIWIFRKWKITPSRQFKSKIAAGSTGGAGASAVIYGSGKGHGDRSEYNSCEKIYRPEANENGPPMTPVSPAPAYPTAAAIGSEYEYGYAHYEQLQQQQSMGSDNSYQQPSYHYGYNSGAIPAMSEASAMRVSVVDTSSPDANVIGGVPATGHNVHGYGSEDFTKNDHFLRELRE
ncbi:hypothetical protein BGZ97_002232 [Linnemannia gamsii]|uniref:Mid2 domain-containing protein n=1 Tax=Linnemannia gamsii TaxID=64522 RepID=A0A9P6UIP4_9FUNG|nr:hypothetical protein BGZ97_002232 [Linnemannia gamsii]